MKKVMVLLTILTVVLLAGGSSQNQVYAATKTGSNQMGIEFTEDYDPAKKKPNPIFRPTLPQTGVETSTDSTVIGMGILAVVIVGISWKTKRRGRDNDN